MRVRRLRRFVGQDGNGKVAVHGSGDRGREFREWCKHAARSRLPQQRVIRFGSDAIPESDA